MKKRYYLVPFIPQKLLRVVAKVFVKIFLRPKIYGLQHLRSIKGPFILASNHQNELDPVIVLAAIPFRDFLRPIFFAALSKKYYQKRGLRGKLFYGGWLFWILGAHPVYLGLNDYQKSLRHHLKILENGGVTYIFPEGKINKGERLKAKAGVSYLRHRVKVKVLPLYVSGLEEENFLKAGLTFRRKLIMKFGRPIDVVAEDSETLNQNEILKNDAESILDEIYKLGESLK